MNKKMTRKEQIKQAAREYATHLTDTGEMDYYGHFEKDTTIYLFLQKIYLVKGFLNVNTVKTACVVNHII